MYQAGKMFNQIMVQYIVCITNAFKQMAMFPKSLEPLMPIDA